MKTVLCGILLNGEEKDKNDFDKKHGVPNLISKSLDKLGISYTIEEVELTWGSNLTEKQIVADLTNEQLFALMEVVDLPIIVSTEGSEEIGVCLSYKGYERTVTFLDDEIHLGDW